LKPVVEAVVAAARWLIDRPIWVERIRPFRLPVTIMPAGMGQGQEKLKSNQSFPDGLAWFKTFSICHVINMGRFVS